MKKELENKKITYKIKFIDSLRFIVSSLSDLADNLAEGLHYGKWKDCKSCLEYANVKDSLLLFSC